MKMAKKRDSKKDSYVVTVRAGPFSLGSIRAKSLAEARTLSISIASQLPIAAPNIRAATAEIGFGSDGWTETVAMFVPKADGVAEYENELYAIEGDATKLHPRPKKLALVLAPAIIAAAAKMVAAKKRRGSRRR